MTAIAVTASEWVGTVMRITAYAPKHSLAHDMLTGIDATDINPKVVWPALVNVYFELGLSREEEALLFHRLDHSAEYFTVFLLVATTGAFGQLNQNAYDNVINWLYSDEHVLGLWFYLAVNFGTKPLNTSASIS